MSAAIISGTGLHIPPYAISNEELVSSFNEYVARYNRTHAEEISRGVLEALAESSIDFIIKASGIENRYVVDREGILDPRRMMPRLRERPDEELSILAEMAVEAARGALADAGNNSEQIDCVIVACSNMQRAYPAIAIEVQQALGMSGFAFDVNVACSSAVFGIRIASGMIAAGEIHSALVVSPEICTGHLDFRDRDSHFIFGDVATAVLLESEERCSSPRGFAILGTKARTIFSNNIRNNFGFLNRTHLGAETSTSGRLFKQRGRRVFKEVVPLVAELIREHLEELQIPADRLERIWLHQANIHMNVAIASKVLGEGFAPERVPNVLREFANTSSAGSIIAFHRHRDDLASGALGLLCAFGAGYSAGSVILRRA